MAPISVPIPLAVLDVGPTTYGPATVPDDVNLATITIDRTVSRPQANGFNAQPATTRAELAVEQSSDGGATWQFRASAGIIGGIYEGRPGQPFLYSDIQVELTPGTGRRVRGVVTVSGAKVAVAGTLAVT